MNENPWQHLPDEPPYVLPEDKDKVLAFNEKARLRSDHKLHLDLIPEPFVGRKDAPLVLLGNNPGVKDKAAADSKRNPAFANRMRSNLLHQLSDDYPFLYLDPDITIPGKGWWERKLKSLLSACGTRNVARSLLAVEFFPYVSRRYRHGKLICRRRNTASTLCGMP